MTSAPWRRPDNMQGNSLSTGATEFVPSWKQESLSAGAMEFVPSWKQEQAPPTSIGVCCCIDLGAYTDDSDESDAEVIATPVAAVPKVASSRPWRLNAPEFVPRVHAPEFIPREFIPRGIIITSDNTENEDASGLKSPPRASPWRRSATTAQKTNDSNLNTPVSTSEGCPSPVASVDDTSLASNASSRDSSASRSCSPAPQEKACPLGIQALLQWRAVSPTEKPQVLPSAAQPEPGTVAASIAAYTAKFAADAVGGGGKVAGMNNSTPSWRQRSEEVAQEEQSWRPVPIKLEVSDDSWLARQTARRRTKSSISTDAETKNDEEIIRSMKSILNKLTVEKFESLSVQLVNCGIRNTHHLELLIQEVFEKATTQHHFIDMYADLCDLLNSHFGSMVDDDGTKKSFKKVLLHCCQASFEKNLTPPKNLAALSGEDRTIAERLYKMRMLGNIKFVGSLLVRKMLASKVMLAIMEELLQAPTGESLESLAALLTVVGPTFDTPDWSYRATLNAIFVQVEKFSKKDSIDPRSRCLLKDVLDLRNLNWLDRRPKKIEGPLKLQQVAAKAAMETGSGYTNGHMTPKAAFSPTSCTNVQTILAKAAVSPTNVEKTTRGGSAGAAMLEFLRNREKPVEKPCEKAPFDKEACNKEISATIAELRVSFDVQEAITRVANISVPVPDQASQVHDILARLAEEGSHGTRKVGFGFLVGLVLEGHWKAESAEHGLRKFLEETCPDLKYDVPNLPQILQEELHTALSPLVKAGMILEPHLDE